MPSSLKIARLVDSEALAKIHQACFEKGWSKDDIISYLRRPACYAVWMEETAFVLFEIIQDETEIKTIAVLENHRKKNIASHLCQEVLDVSREFGVKKILLEVSEKNQAALGLYNKLGFQEYNRRTDYYAKGEDAILMKYGSQ